MKAPERVRRVLLPLLIGFLLGLSVAAPRGMFIGSADAVSRPTQFDMGSALCFQSSNGLSCVKK